MSDGSILVIPSISIRARSILGYLGLAFICIMIWSAEIAAQPAADSRYPVLRLPTHLPAKLAVRGLGPNLPRMAEWYGMSTQRFKTILEKDETAWLDRAGKVFFIDHLDHPLVPEAHLPRVRAPQRISQSVSDPFKLHSRENSTRTVYLNFTGAVVIGTAWNQYYGQTINAPVFDIDGDPTTFSVQERAAIQEIWQQVAEDFAPFDVDITTEPQLSSNLTRSGSQDDRYGIQVNITRDVSQNSAYPCDCGGIAFLGIFDEYSSGNYYKPAWVFYDQLGAENNKYIAESATHEIGHTLGLSHDGDATSAYAEGYTVGNTSWAPIMGVGYYSELSQWSKGEYLNANNFEDDIAIIQNHGPAIVADDHGNTLVSATPLTTMQSDNLSIVLQHGLIEQQNDVDYFTFYAGNGVLQLDITPSAHATNLNLMAVLLDAQGHVVNTFNPNDRLGIEIRQPLTSGTYFLKVDGVGQGNLSNGFSDYASLGHYTIRGSYAFVQNQYPVAVINAQPKEGREPLDVTFDAIASSDSNGAIADYYWDFGDGSVAHAPSFIHTYKTAGSYTAKLTVTDQLGLKQTTTETIIVTPDPLANTFYLRNIAMAKKSLNDGYYQCLAKVSVRNYSGKVLANAKIYGRWSGIVNSKLMSTVTNTYGTAVFQSVKLRKMGTCTFTVTKALASGYKYDATQNRETSDSLTN